MATATSLLRTQGIRSNKVAEYLTSRLKLAFVTVTFGSSENYATGGIAVLSILKTASKINNLIACSPIEHNVSGYMAFYDNANGKIMFFGTGSSAGALEELANNSTAINSKSVKFLLLGT